MLLNSYHIVNTKSFHILGASPPTLNTFLLDSGLVGSPDVFVHVQSRTLPQVQQNYTTRPISPSYMFY